MKICTICVHGICESDLEQFVARKLYMVTLRLSNFESQPSYSLDMNKAIIIFLRFQSTYQKARHSLNLSSPPPQKKRAKTIFLYY